MLICASLDPYVEKIEMLTSKWNFYYFKTNWTWCRGFSDRFTVDYCYCCVTLNHWVTSFQPSSLPLHTTPTLNSFFCSVYRSFMTLQSNVTWFLPPSNEWTLPMLPAAPSTPVNSLQRCNHSNSLVYSIRKSIR